MSGSVYEKNIYLVFVAAMKFYLVFNISFINIFLECNDGILKKDLLL